ncbi:hypothetical protein Mgra_00008207 [Meloidogyne graminicola]|uniref:Alpha,alpha-trehalose-phosphate synthase (UDP-forming) n=1 Tax=Meloidogyne graminicola TaxID=189291 RepID=A0A8S9ZGB6_9BILA|nr:hypothetical protein Mgra_00008207 [Meloidogyne graminicola]
MLLKINLIFLQLIFLFYVGNKIEASPEENIKLEHNTHIYPSNFNSDNNLNSPVKKRKFVEEKVHPKKIKLEEFNLKAKYERIILASNAPPFGLEKEKLKHPLNSNNPYAPEMRKIAHERYLEIKKIGGFKQSKLLNEETKWIATPASGGLVSAVKPMMEKNDKNVWVFHVTPSDPKLAEEDDPKLQELKNHKEAFELNPLLIDLTTYEFYYKDISNSILWPALHNIPEYIEYEEEKLENWLNDYKQVNEMFATKIYNINRNINDLIWVQDYQLLLVGKYLRNKEKENKTIPMNLGFFLHTPFELKDEFVNNFKKFTKEILEGILSFNKVGFQTNKDRNNFIELVKKFFPECVTSKKLTYMCVENITPKGDCFLGVYPATININKFINYDEEAIKKKDEIKEKIMENAIFPEGKLFFSVERFDYTKGIKEKILAFKKYLINNPDRIGKDVFYQLAPLNRESIAAYKNYQNECRNLINEINKKFDYVAIDINTNSMKREDVFLHYLAMDVGVITPVMDGMNLVAKEMIISNPNAAIILSEGAGTHHQLFENGLSNNYFLVKDITNSENFAQVIKDSINLKGITSNFDRIILASNAPPFHLEENKPKDYPIRQTRNESLFKKLIKCFKTSTKQNIKTSEWQIKQASGGLVSAVEPIMKANKENIWVYHVTPSDPSLSKENDPKLQTIENYRNNSPFGLVEVLIDINKFTNYYQEISNNILWPALHGISDNVFVNDEHSHEQVLSGCNLGVYSASIETGFFIKLASEHKTRDEAKDFKKKALENSLPGGKLFFSVERFDYTKGIKEKILAYQKYLINNPDRIGKDVFYQLAPLNREKIKTYSRYQNECRDLILQINENFGVNYKREDGEQIKEGYKAIDIRTLPLEREKLILRYLAMDVGVITPVMDGMNLVAKEMIISNPNAAIILSEGAGTHHQLFENDLSNNYFLVKDINNSENFAQVMQQAATLPEKERKKRGKILKNFVIENDVNK